MALRRCVTMLLSIMLALAVVQSPAAAATAPVTGVAARPSATSIALSWVEPAGSDGVLIRRLAGTRAPGRSEGVAVADVTAPGASYLDTGLAAGTRYSYSLFAHTGGVYAAAATSFAGTLATGGITGKITAADGSPVAGAEVAIADHGGTFVEFVQTAGNGSYLATGLAPSNAGYYVCADYQQQEPLCWVSSIWDGHSVPSDAKAIPVTAGTTTAGIDVRLAAIGSITGRVTELAGVPLSGVQVEAFSNGYGGQTVTTADGSYRLTGLTAGRDYTVCYLGFSARGGSTTGYADQCYRNIPWHQSFLGVLPSGTTPIRVAAGGTASGIDAKLAALGSISGRLTSSVTGAAVAGVDVELVNEQGQPTDGVTTAADGTYALSMLDPAATGYFVCFDGSRARSGNTIGFRGQCYRNIPWSGTAGSDPAPGSVRVPVAPGQAVTGIGAVLVPR